MAGRIIGSSGLPRPPAQDFRDRLQGSSAIESFIQQHLQLDQRMKDECGQVLDILHQYLCNCFPSDVGEMIKGGSFGQGTALKDRSDIDLVVVCNSLRDITHHVTALETALTRLSSHLQNAFSTKYGNWVVRFEGTTRFAVKFKIQRDSGSPVFDVDLLPIFPVSVSTGADRERLYLQMKRLDAAYRDYYSAALVKVQRDFIGKQPPNVKNLMRLVKYWRKTCFEETTSISAASRLGPTSNYFSMAAGSVGFVGSVGSVRRLPASYPLELITIHAWEKAGSPQSFDIAQGFKAVMHQLVNYVSLRVVWENYYSKSLVDRSDFSGYPVVIDPANPTRNVCKAANAWPEVARVANQTLYKPICASTVILHRWQNHFASMPRWQNIFQNAGLFQW